MVDRIFDTLHFRKVYHFIGGIVILTALLLLDLSVAAFLCALYLVAFRLWAKRVSFAVLAVLLLLVLTRSKFAAAGAVLVFTFGDGVAAVIGSRYGVKEWPWNNEKTILGSTAFLLSSLLSMWIFVKAVLPGLGAIRWVLIIVPALIGSILECLPFTFVRDRKSDDNLIIILVCGLMLYGLQIALGLGLPAGNTW